MDVRRQRLAAWLLCAGLGIVAAAPLRAVAAEADALLDAADVPDAEIEVLRQQAERQGEFEVLAGGGVRVDAAVLAQDWRAVPFDQAPFTLDRERMARDWPVLMRLYGAPWPSEEYLAALYGRWPALKPDGKDAVAVAAAVQATWQMYFRGDFQAASEAGDEAGFAGAFPALLSQVMYAQYLEPDLARKHMLLQDVADRIARHAGVLKAMKKDPAFRREYALMRLMHVYALGRIAEDIPVAEAVRRGYAFKVIDGVDDFSDLLPEHPLTPALLSGVDANVVRKVGKAMGRITFGAKQSKVRDGFEATLAKVPDSAVIRYEYANALLFIDRKRGLALAIAELQQAAAQKPRSALEALDAMYAVKRRRELQALQAAGGSFRAFERKRMAWQKETGKNLFCVTEPPYLFPGGKAASR